MFNKILVTMTIGSALINFSSRASIPKFSKNRVIVKMKEGQALPSSPYIKSYQKMFNNYYVVRTENLFKLEASFKTESSIEMMERDYLSQREALPQAIETESLERDFSSSVARVFNDPGLGKLWAFRDIEKNGMNISKVYTELGNSLGDKVIVAVVDTGVDYNHEDLKNVMWTNPGEIAGNGIDDDNNGYIDDIHGINTLKRDADDKATMEVMDGHSHGTHVSGTIAAEQGNGTGIAGVASNVAIMAIRTVPNSGDETDVDVSEAFLYAARNGAKIINCSFGKSHNEGGLMVKETIDYIGKEYGVLVVAAAGNSTQNIDKRLTYPASFDSENLLVVASTTKRGKLSYFSNYGLKNVDVAAPGSSIYSTTPNNKYSRMSGTSMASPNTAGFAAEVLSRNPSLSVTELKELLMSTVLKVRKYDRKVASGGLLDLKSALDL